MSVYDINFTFEKPGSYFLQAPNTYIAASFFHEAAGAHPIKRVRSLALSSQDDLHLAWEKISGRIAHASLTNSGWDHFNRQEDWIYRARLAFGSEIDYYMAIGDDRIMWSGVGKDLHYKLCNWYSAADGTPIRLSRCVKTVALGLNKSWVIIWADGRCDYSRTQVNYPDLHELLLKSEQGDVVFVALNPHRKNEYFVALAEGTVHIRASSIRRDDIESVLRDSGITVISSSSREIARPAEHPVRERDIQAIPAAARTREFLRQLAASAGGGIIAGIVVMAVSCTVM